MRRTLRSLGHVVRADFLERVRRHGFFVTLGATLYAAYAFLPPAESNVTTLQIAGHRGIYNSAWVGCSVAMLATVFLSMIGFYLVKNAVERDRRTGVGQILATTPLSKPLYTLGKAGSNLAVLGTLALLLAVGAMGMQLLRGEDRHVDAVAMLVPFAIITLPALAVVSALAVLFESIRWLRGGLGNVVYFFLFTGGVGSAAANAGRLGGLGDFLGTSALMPGMIRDVAAAFPGVDPVNPPMSMGFSIREGAWHLVTFTWQGPDWTAEVLLGRLGWLLIGATLALVAAIPFDRFDTAPAPARARGRRGRGGAAAVATGADVPAAAPQIEPQVAPHVAPRGIAPHELTPVAARSFGFLPLLRAELTLMLRGMPWPWWLIAAGLAVACALTPLAVARGVLLPIAWIWPLLLWSPMGAREALHQTEGLLFSSPRPLARQLAATWAAGALVALTTGLGLGVRLAVTGDAAGLAAWLAGACFIPSLAIACGTWTGNGRMFEVLYLLLWYVGPMNHMAALDFIGTGTGSAAAGAPLRFAAIAAILIVLGALGRIRRLRG